MHLENRMIAMLDVLGLSNQISDKDKLLSVVNTYKELISEAKHSIFNQETMAGSQSPSVTNFEVGEFVFDTIVLVSPPIESISSSNFILSVIRLMELFGKKNMPLRGAIGIGDYCQDEETSIFLSNVFKKLSKEESNQQWSGCVLLEDSEERIISEIMGEPPETAKKSDVMHLLTIPTKSSSAERRWCLNWSYKLLPHELNSLLEYMNGDLNKQNETRNYLDYLSSLPDDVQSLPPEFYPAVKLKVVKTRGAINILFEDENGLPVKPGCKEWSLEIFHQQ